MKGRWAIINVSDLYREFWYLFTLRSCCSTHHRRLIRFRISDGKFVNHTTEMILWSMILSINHRFCLCNKTIIRLQIGEQNFEPSNDMMHLGLYATWKFKLLLVSLSHHHCPRWTTSKTPRHLWEELFTSSAHYLGRGQWTTCCSFSSAFYKSNDRK